MRTKVFIRDDVEFSDLTGDAQYDEDYLDIIEEYRELQTHGFDSEANHWDAIMQGALTLETIDGLRR